MRPFLVERRRESAMKAELRAGDHGLDGGLDLVVVLGQAALNFHQQRLIGQLDGSSE
jgi:hypothetical protein